MEITRELRRLMRRDESVDADEATRLWGAILDEALDDLEVGAVIGMLAGSGESDAELAGLYRATSARLAPWSPALRGIVSIPAYGHMPGEALWVALAGALLRRYGVPVLVHGVLDSPCGLSTARVLRDLGVLPCASLAEAGEHLHAGRIAFLPAQLLLPPFAALIALRGRFGIENAAHVVAQAIDPTHGTAVRMTFAMAGRASAALRRLDPEVQTPCVSLDWPAERSPWHYELRPCIERLAEGRRELLFEADTQEARAGFVALEDDAHAVADWVARVCNGAVPVPIPALNLVAACLYAVGQAQSLTQAKAVAAIHAGRLAA
jgi:anthranilate phosphoribosyltransferase